jgi:hypothetical protein
MKEQDKGSALVGMLLEAAEQSLADLRRRVANVRLCDISIAADMGVECIEFEFDGKHHRAKLVGRMKDVVIGWSEECDRRVALSLLLDGHAEELAEGVVR